jgi:ABC-2 type transport system permease protein
MSPDPSFKRIASMVLRYWYLIRSSWPRVLELMYWPMVQMLTWGFLQLYLSEQQGVGVAVGGTLIGAVLLWDILFRGQLGFSMSFLEEMWSRNMGNIFMSPLRPWEFIASLMTVSIIRLAIGFIPVSLMAMFAFDFNIWALGLGFGLFFANLMITGWALGLIVCGLILRNGLGAEGLVWALMFLMLPLASVYYPVDTLPQIMQTIAWALPPTYVFEGLRALVLDGILRTDLLLSGFLLNCLMLTCGILSFTFFLKASRKHATLLQMGE